MTYFYYSLVFVFGLAAGSFLNVWVWRTWENLNIVVGRSMCPHCRHLLAWYDNIPLLSFLLLRGKCRYCSANISWQYPVVELITGLLALFVAVWHRVEEGFVSPQMVLHWVIVFFLIFIFIYDLKYREILDAATLPLALMVYLISLAMNWLTWDALLLGVIAGGGFFFIQYVVSKGRWIGGGDIRLGILMGAILGWPNVVMAIMLAYIIGSVISLIFIGLKLKTWKDEIPFGTFLTVTTFIVMFWGERIVGWYLGLLK